MSRVTNLRETTGETSVIGAPMAGDLGGTLPAPIVEGIQSIPVDATPPTDHQQLVYDASLGEYVPQGSLLVVTLEAGDLVNPLGVGLGTWKAVPLAGSIVAVYLEVDGTSPSCEVDCLWENSAIPTGLGSSVFGTDTPSLVASAFGYFAPTANWRATVAIHDVLRLSVLSASGVTRATLQVLIRQ